MATPEGWSCAKLSGIGDGLRPAIKAGPFGSALKKSSYVRGGYRVYGQEQVIAGDFAVGDYYIDDAKFESLRSCAVQPGDVLMSLVGTFGRVAIVPPHAEPGIINPRLLRLSPDLSRVEPAFLRAYLESETVQEALGRTAQGGTMGVLNATTLAPLEILLPPLPEQRKIAAILSSVDETIEKTEAVIEQLQVVKKAMMQELLTRGMPGRHTRFKQTEIGEIPEVWDVRSVYELGPDGQQVVRTGPFGSSLKGKDFVASGVPVMTIQSLGEGEILRNGLFYVDDRKATELADYLVQPNDLVFSRVADIGRCAAIGADEDGWLISSNLTRVRLDPTRMLSRYLMYLLTMSPDVRRQIEMVAGGGARPVISSTTLQQIRLPVPGAAEQREIVEACESVEANLRAERLLRSWLVRTKAALSTALLSGDLRVIPDAST